MGCFTVSSMREVRHWWHLFWTQWRCCDIFYDKKVMLAFLLVVLLWYVWFLMLSSFLTIATVRDLCGPCRPWVFRISL